MPDTPIAKLHLDTRANGPYFCENCDEENEDALLMSDASVVCPKCKTPLEAFEQFSDAIVSVSPLAAGSKKKSRGSRWVIDYESPDSSQEGAVAYDDMDAALEAAANWIKQQATEILENDKLRKEADSEDDPWEEEDQEHFEEMESILKAIEEKRLDEAVEEWLIYQSDMTPDENISIGPSGDASSSSFDFRRAVDSERR